MCWLWRFVGCVSMEVRGLGLVLLLGGAALSLGGGKDVICLAASIRAHDWHTYLHTYIHDPFQRLDASWLGACGVDICAWVCSESVPSSMSIRIRSSCLES